MGVCVCVYVCVYVCETYTVEVLFIIFLIVMDMGINGEMGWKTGRKGQKSSQSMTRKGMALVEEAGMPGGMDIKKSYRIYLETKERKLFCDCEKIQMDFFFHDRSLRIISYSYYFLFLMTSTNVNNISAQGSLLQKNLVCLSVYLQFIRTDENLLLTLALVESVLR